MDNQPHFTNDSDFSQGGSDGTEISETKISFRKWRWVLAFSLAFIVAGILVLIWPEALYRTLAYFFGGVLMLSSIYKIFLERPDPGVVNSKRGYSVLTGGIILIISLILLLNPQILRILLPILFAMMVFFLALLLLALSQNLAGYRIGRIFLISGVVFLVIAGLAFFYPENSGDILGRVVGVVLMMTGIGGIFLSRFLKNTEWRIPFQSNVFRKFR